MASDPKAVSLAYLKATGEKQWDKLTALLHPDLDFKMPGMNLNKVDFVSSVSKLGPILLRNDIKKVFVDGDEVCVIYDFVTDTPVGAVPSVEWLKIQDAHVRSIWLLFDRQPWPAVLEELARRAGRAS
ncbi:MAG: nuclear transport factor 2 family protein [bacterium]